MRSDTAQLSDVPTPTLAASASSVSVSVDGANKGEIAMSEQERQLWTEHTVSELQDIERNYRSVLLAHGKSACFCMDVCSGMCSVLRF